MKIPSKNYYNYYNRFALIINYIFFEGNFFYLKYDYSLRKRIITEIKCLQKQIINIVLIIALWISPYIQY